ncbi:ATP-dependent nuclease [Aeromonas veronii]|uniref:ATP-dependent nuclease n=1 Tax=Aeromonas veronii TaxID=654 RepID=UPI0038D56522
MFIESVKIENFKGFHGDNNILQLKIPDGVTEGSGLNIFVGENNSGKSTVFEIFDFIKDGTKKDITELLNKSIPTNAASILSVEVTYTGNIRNIINNHIQGNKVGTFLSSVYDDNGQEKFKVKRGADIDNEGDLKKILFWNETDGTHSNTSGIDAPFKKLYDNNFIWADTNPSDESKFGSSTICGALLKEIAAGHISTAEYQEFTQVYNNIFNNPASQLRTRLAQIENSVQDVFSSQFGHANISFTFDEPQIDSFFKTAGILIDDGVSVPMGEKGHGMQRAVALALLQVYAHTTSNASNAPISKPFFLFIDEPEICLHPSGQTKLLEALMMISKERQVFITTHSPFMLSSPKLRNAGLFIFKKTNNISSVSRADTSPMFPWSPSWGEISYRAYNLPTVELHNELYGHLQELSSSNTIRSFEQWLSQHGIQRNKLWTQERQGVPQQPEQATLQTFIRNHIHHPENTTMRGNIYTQSELEQSISEMVGLLALFR